MTITLQQALIKWDGRNRLSMETVYQNHKADPDLPSTLVTLCRQTDTERGASWLLKACADDGTLLEEHRIDMFYHALLEASYWESRLHLLQILHHYPTPDQLQAQVYQFLTHQLQDPNKFIRAWSYHALEHVARWYPAYREEVDAFIALALKDEAPSVQARLRRLKSV